MVMRRKGVPEGRRRAGKAASLEIEGVDAIAAQHLRVGPEGLEAFFTGGGGHHANRPIRLQFLDHFDRETMQALAQGWAIWNASEAAPTTRDNRMQRLKYGFVQWMREVEQRSPNITEMDADLIGRFAAWLNEPASPGFVEDRKTRCSYLFAIEEPLFRLSLSDIWAPRLSNGLHRLKNPFGSARTERLAQAASRPDTKTIMDRATYDALWDEAACRVEADMAAYENQLDELERLAASGAEVALDARTAGCPAALATWLIKRYPPRVPGYGSFDKRSVYRRLVTKAQHVAATDLIRPDATVVVPFIYLTTAFFALNTTVVLGLTLDDYRLDDVPGGSRRLRIFPDKPRSDSRQRHAVAETTDAANPARYLPYLERRTAYLRSIAPATLRRKAFIYFDGARGSAPAVFPKTTATLRGALRNMSRTRHIDHVALSDVRSTTLDVVHDLTEGNLVETTAFANHKSVATTHTDYRSQAMRNRYDEMQGDALQEWERFWGTGGKVDAIARPPRIDRTAATPGYICRNPHRSPVQGERGRLCRAYGQCPACELAIVPDTSPHSYRCLMALLARLEEAEREMSALAYQARWAEVKVWLVTQHLPLFGDDTKAAAAGVVIPTMPRLD